MKKTKEKNPLIQIIPYYKKYLWLSIATILFSGLYTLLAIFGPILEGKLLDTFTNFDANRVINIAILTGIDLLLIQLVYKFWSDIVLKLNAGVNFDLKKSMLRNILNLQVKNFDNLNSGLFIARINKDAYALSELFDDITDDLSTVCLNVTFIVYSFFINFWLGLFLLGYIIILYFFETLRVKKIMVQYDKYKQLDEKVIGNYSEVIRGVRDIKNLNLKETMLEKTNKEQYNAILQEKKTIDTRRTLKRVSDSIKIILDAVFVILGVYMIVDGNLTIGNFLVLFVYRKNIKSLINSVTNIREKMANGKVSAKRVFEIINTNNFPKEEFGTLKIENIEGKIEFKKVKFEYTKEKPLFESLSFSIPENCVAAFVGKSGEGKSSVINLINKNYAISDGQILIGGHNIDDFDEQSLRQNISIVPQSPYIFNMSINDNLLLVKPDATQEEISNACELAGINGYITTLAQGYDTIIGENGITLSGGQKQRLAIARAILKQSKIILFDEATSALDNETQEKINIVIKTLSKNHTCIVVAHRLSTIINSDIIYVIDNHKIEAQGKHKELLKTSDVYKQLYKDLNSNE